MQEKHPYMSAPEIAYNKMYKGTVFKDNAVT